MKLSVKYFVLLSIVAIFQATLSYRILGIFPLNFKSHFMIFGQLMKGLARRGHQVDVVSVFPLKTPYPNYTDITIKSHFRSPINKLPYDYIQTHNKADPMFFRAQTFGNEVCESVLKNPKIQKLISNPPNDPPYDLIVMEVSHLI